MIKVLFLTINLGGGGAERVLVNLVNHINREKFDLTVETMFEDGVNADFLSPDIKYVSKKALSFKGITLLFRLLPQRILYNYFIGGKEYDIIIAFMHGIPVKVISGCKYKKIKKVCWLHNGKPKTGSFFKSWISEKNAISAYADMDLIVGVSNSVCEAFSDYTGINNTITLYNPNDLKRIIQMSEESLNFPFEQTNTKELIICSVGGLSLVKGYDRLINIAKRLHDEDYNFKVVIVGSGPQENEFRELINKLNAESYIYLLGFQKNPYAIMKKADFFVSTSREEGLATVLTEALALGLPVLSTDVSGAKEVLGNNNEYGLVVDNSNEGIYSGVKLFLSNHDLVQQYASVAKQRSMMFDIEHTVPEVEKMIENVVSDS